MSKLYLGIDPGSVGCLACQCDGKWEWYFLCEMDYRQLAETFRKLRQNYDQIACVMEDVKSVHGSSSTSTFSFGENKGMLLGMLNAFNIPYTLVSPRVWQAECWIAADKQFTTKIVKDKNGMYQTKKSVNTKPTSINAAKRLFPMIDFKRNDRCKKIDDNKVDATLMSEYARRKNL